MATPIQKEDYIVVERANGDPQQQTIAFQNQVLTTLATLQSSFTAMGHWVSQLEGSNTGQSPNEDETSQSGQPSEGEQNSAGEGQRPQVATAHVDSGANAGNSHLQFLQSTPTAWADRHLDESIDYSVGITWPEDEDETETKGVRLFKILKRSEDFLNSCFTHSVPNTTRRTIKDKYGAPNTVKTPWLCS